MTAHELAKALLAGPDLPVVFDEFVDYDTTELCEVVATEPMDSVQFNGSGDNADTPRGALDVPAPRACVRLECCERVVPSAAEEERRKAGYQDARERAEKLKREDPAAYALKYAEIKPLTPADIEQMASAETGLAQLIAKRPLS